MYQYRDTSTLISRPLIIVAPHGHPNDDARTCNIATQMADDLDCYKVNNVAWERHNKIDIKNLRANLNNIDHGLHSFIKPDWIDKIIQYKDECVKQFAECFVFFIHGMSDTVKQRANDPNLDMIVGYGAGSQAGESMDLNQKDALILHLANLGLTVYGGKAGGSFAGAGSKNLNQLFRADPNYLDPNVQSAQIEIVYSLRSSDKTAEACGKLLAHGVKNWLNGTIGVPNIKIKEF